MPLLLGCGVTQEELIVRHLRDVGTIFALSFPATVALGLLFASLLHAGRALSR